MIQDSKAEKPEVKRVYRRAAARRAEVMVLVETISERDEAVKHRKRCTDKPHYSHIPTVLTLP